MSATTHTSCETPGGADAVLYYDGSCPVCAREIGFYRPRAEGVRFVDVSRCGDDALGGDLDRAAALDRLHLRTPDGALVSGAEAVAGVWRRVPGLGWLGRAFAHPVPARALEAFYRVFLALRARLPHVFRSHCGTLPADVAADLRSDHAGETGAVAIYRGILAVSRDAGVRGFALEHLATEQRHLDQISAWLPERQRSALLPLWKAAGWSLGALPALFGARAVFHTIDAVETFVDRHYQAQIDRLAGDPAFADLRATLIACQADEAAHRDDARERAQRAPGPIARAWAAVVGAGSAGAVVLARWV